MNWLPSRWTLAAIGFLIFGGVLIWQNVVARVELRAAALAGLRLDVERRAASISQFLAERSNELAELGRSPEVASYYANRALRMQSGHGSRTDLAPIDESFRRLRAARTISGSQIYGRIALIDGDGSVLVDVPGREAHIPPAPIAGTDLSSAGGERFSLGRASDDIVLTMPVVSHGAQLGRIVAFCSLETVVKHFLRAAHSEGQVQVLAASDGRPLSAEWQAFHFPPAVIAAISPNQLRRAALTGRDGDDESFALVKAAVDGTPLFVVGGASEALLSEKLPPLAFVVGSAVLPVLGLGAAAFMTRRRRPSKRPWPDRHGDGHRHGEHAGSVRTVEAETQRREAVEREFILQRAELQQRTLELQQSMARAHQLATYDEITGLANRTLFRELLRNALARSQRSGRPLAVLFLDLDRFKRINDTLGHSTGDQLLREMAGRLQRCLRGADSIGRADAIGSNHWVSRPGGDEFTILLPELDTPESAAVVANRIIENLCRPVSLAGQEVVCTVSIGVSVFPRDGTDVDALLRSADAAMYSAKERGRNQFQYFENSLHEKAVGRLALENAMRRGLDAGEFDVHYQPILDAVTGTVVALEALMRWQHPARGMVPPSAFIPVAEETGMIVPLTRQVLTQVCRQIAEWRNSLDREIKVAINLSGRTIELAQVGEMIHATLAQNSIPARLLEIELTETVLMEGRDEARALIDDLKRLGVSLSIDDFGTGYSSLAYLRSFAIDYLKIDRSFVRDIPGDDNSETIVRTIIGMAHSLGLQVVAEGVENQTQWHFLRKAGCELVQGFLFCRPVPAVEITQRLAAEKSEEFSNSAVTPIRVCATS